MRSATAGQRRSFGLALFFLTVIASAGFAACASLKSAPVAEDAGLDGTTGEVDGTTDTDTGATADALTTGDASDATLTDADAGRTRWPYCGTNGPLCSCTSWSFEMDSSSCAATDYDGGFCCAEPGWPTESNANCTCGAWTCHTTGSGTCACGAYSEGGAATSCTDTFCCAHPFLYTCTCASTKAAACPSALGDANNIPVTSCTQPAQPCAKGGARVSSCSF
jgi:hypothetical protein